MITNWRFSWLNLLNISFKRNLKRKSINRIVDERETNKKSSSAKDIRQYCIIVWILSSYYYSLFVAGHRQLAKKHASSFSNIYTAPIKKKASAPKGRLTSLNSLRARLFPVYIWLSAGSIPILCVYITTQKSDGPIKKKNERPVLLIGTIGEQAIIEAELWCKWTNTSGTTLPATSMLSVRYRIIQFLLINFRSWCTHYTMGKNILFSIVH